MSTSIPRPPVPLPTPPEFVNVGTRRVACYYPQDLDKEAWKPLAGPFFPGEISEDDDLLSAHLEQVIGTWSVLVRGGSTDFWIYRHYCEMDPFMRKSGAVFVRDGLAPWMREEAIHWAERGLFTT